MRVLVLAHEYPHALNPTVGCFVHEQVKALPRHCEVVVVSPTSLWSPIMRRLKAAWAYYAATHYILGIRPEYSGLRIDPCVPSSWRSFHIRRSFRHKIFDINIENEKGVQKGVEKIIINGSEIKGNLIPIEKMEDQNTVHVSMG